MSEPTADPPSDRPPLKRSNSVPFPSPEEERLKESRSSESNLTSSDKLSALPAQPSPMLERLRTPTRTVRKNVDASSSLTSIDSASGSLQGLHSLPGPIKQSESDSSVPKDTPRQRNESERSLPATFKQSMLGRLGHHSDSVVASRSLRSREGSVRGHAASQSPPPSRHGHSRSQSNRPSDNLSPLMQGKDTFQTPPSRSPAQSRATSPLRILHGWTSHRNQTKEEPFIPVDPFSSHIRWFGFRRDQSPSRPSIEDRKPNWLLQRLNTLFPGSRKRDEDEDVLEKRQKWHVFMTDTLFFLSDTLPRQAYIWFLLRLPALYWQRVARVFEDAEVSKPEIQRLIDACGLFAHDPSIDAAIATGFASPTQKTLSLGLPYPEEWTPPLVSPALARFKISWENFVDTLMREWKTFNLVSALLCTTILTIFQIPEAAADPLTRWAALLSLVFALMSLSYGCAYIVHFGTMRTMDRASRWAEESRKTRAALFWNIWVLLATPAIWLAWSMICFCVAILSFIWRTGSQADSEFTALTPSQALGVRIAISVVFGFGLFNFWMIIRTFSSYSRISVRRDRRSRIQAGRAPAEAERGRTRRAAHGAGSDDGKERERPHRERPHGKHPSDPMVGLGLTGLNGDNSAQRQGSPSMAGVILENVDLERGEGVYLAGERMGALHKLSPRVSPKL